MSSYTSPPSLEPPAPQRLAGVEPGGTLDFNRAFISTWQLPSCQVPSPGADVRERDGARSAGSSRSKVQAAMPRSQARLSSD